MTIKRIPEGAKSFEANGKKFILHESLTVSGWEKSEELRLELEVGSTVKDLVGQIKEAYEHLDKSKPASAAIVLYNAISGAERIVEGRPHPLLFLLTLFARPEGSKDEWTEAEATEWINDFKIEGYAVTDLFMLAGSTLKTFALDWQLSSLLTSSPESEEPA